MVLIDILILVWVCYNLPEIINNIKKCDPFYDYNIIVMSKIGLFLSVILILLSIKSIIQWI